MINTIINRLKSITFHSKNKEEIEKLILSGVITTLLLLLTTICTKNFEIFATFKQNHSELIIPISFIIQWLAIFTPYIVIKKGILNIKKDAFCVKKQSIKNTTKDVLKGFFIYFSIVIIATLLIIYGGFQIPGFQAQKQILGEFGTEAINLLIAGLIIVILGPIFEEIAFRGILLKKFTNTVGNKWGSIITATIFALLHMQIETFIPLFIMGLILNHMTIKRKSITSSITFHIINNGIVFTIQLLILLKIINIEQIIS